MRPAESSRRLRPAGAADNVRLPADPFGGIISRIDGFILVLDGATLRFRLQSESMRELSSTLGRLLVKTMNW